MKKCLFSVFIVFATVSAYCQEPYYELTNEYTGGQVFIARDSILLKTGFLYTAGSNEFIGAIDESQLMDETYLTEPIDPAERELNTHYAVGSIKGDFNVTPTGAAVYNIPIAVPPGTAGMQPNLSVVYNSQGGNGLLGMGWELAGISAITRTGATLYHDEFIDAVDFDDNDQFAWDGQRLLEVHDYDDDSTLYATESESFSRIVAYGTSGEGPLRWTIWTKDGTRLEYGNSVDSRHEEQNSESVIRWMLTKVRSRTGNYMLYSYFEDLINGEWRIDNIQYTGNSAANQDPYNTVKFYYGLREDNSVAFVGGSQVKQSVVLRKIRTFAQNDFAHEYQFRYYFDGFTSHLNEIVEVSHTGERLNSTVVGWGEESEPFTIDDRFVPLYFEEGGIDYYSDQYYGDFDGDGFDDMFVAFHYIDGENKYQDYCWKLYKSNNGWFSFVNQGSSTGVFNSYYLVGDINGDGKDDLYRIANVTNTQKEVDISISTGSDFQFYDLGTNSPYRTIEGDFNYFLNGDFNGDGKDNLLIIKDVSEPEDNEYIYIVDFSFSPFLKTIIGYDLFTEDDNANNISCYDFNGDGKTDILWLNESNQLVVWEFNEQNIYSQRIQTLYTGGFPTKGHECFWGDFNGDRMLDVLTYVDANNLWELHINNGRFATYDCLKDGILDCPVTRNYNPNDLAKNNYFTYDFTGDGKSDIFEIYKKYPYLPSNNEYVVNVYASAGNSFVLNSITITTNLSCIYDCLRLVDFNGDGGMDVKFNFDDIFSSPNFKIFSCYEADQKNLVDEISDGLNNTISLNYEIGTRSSYYEIGSIAGNGYPLLSFDGKINLLTHSITDIGSGNFITNQYYYSGGIIHLTGKGFLGMSEFVTKDLSHQIKNINSFDFNTTYYFPEIHTVEVFGGQNMTTQLSSTDYSYETFPVGGSGSKRYLNLPRETVATDHLRNIFTTTSYEDYDNYGNVELLEVDHNGEGTTTTVATYTNAGSFFDYLPLHTTVTNIREIEPSVVNTSYSYNINNGTLSSMTLYEGQNEMFVGKSFLYDNVGNVTSLSVWHPGLETKIQQINYDSKGRFPVTKTNPLLWVEELEYDHRTGQVTKHTDANDRVTKYKYDGFGRNVVTEYADGTNRVASLQWDAGSGPDNACYFAQSQTTGSAPAKTWYDRLGREILSQAVAFDGQWVDVETQYDNLGRLWKVSEPFFHAASPTQYTVYDYDPLGRNYKTTLPTGVKLMTDYDELYLNKISTYKTHDTQTWEQVTQTMNGYGQPVTIADDGGTLTYTYNSMGLPKSITTNGAEVTMEYDLHGNRTLIHDPDAGEITTLYNAYDELTSQTDANQHTYAMTYDKLGRITSRTGEETTNWVYSTAPGHLGELTSVTASNGTAQSYSYDALGRVTLQTETVSGQEFTKSYAYDSYGRVQTENWNTGFGIMYQYNQNGYLSHVKTQNNQLIWQGQAYNARGQVTDYLLGDDYRTTKSWDNYGFQEQILTQTTGATPQDRQKEGYNFDEQKGNLLSRTDHLPYNKTETFEYDGLNRLTHISSVNYSQFHTTFALNGNITQKSDIGTYNYDDAGSHAVTGLTNTTGTLLPAFDQSVDYTAFNKASYISQGEYSYYITYGPDRQRKLSILNQIPGENTVLTKFYAFGDYEKEVTPTGTRHLHYIAGGDGLAAIYAKYDNAPDSLYFIMKDHLGSIVGAINNETGTVYRQNFDAWGRKRNPVDWSYSNIPDFPFDRGYTGHEHLKWFGLINMNGRLYDAAICRFLSPDSYVQMPDYSQSFNRYSYCLNNPLVYTDPDGEWFMAAFFGMAFIADFSSNLINGVHDPAETAYNNATNTTNGINNCLQVPVYQNNNTLVTAGIDPFNFGISANAYHTQGDFTFSASIGYSFLNRSAFANGTLTYTSGDFAFTIGGGYSSSYTNRFAGETFSGGARYYGGISYYDRPRNQYFSGGFTHFGGEYSQNNWFAGYRSGDFSISTTNDIPFSDERRTAALEIGVGNFSTGFNLNTTSPPAEERHDELGGNNSYRSMWDKIYKNPHVPGTYSTGSRIYAGLYFGLKVGNSINRIGLDAPWVQDFFQNGMHRLTGTPYFNTNYGSSTRFFSQGGYNFPYSLYPY